MRLTLRKGCVAATAAEAATAAVVTGSTLVEVIDCVELTVTAGCITLGCTTLFTGP